MSCPFIILGSQTLNIHCQHVSTSILPLYPFPSPLVFPSCGIDDMIHTNSLGGTPLMKNAHLVKREHFDQGLF